MAAEKPEDIAFAIEDDRRATADIPVGYLVAAGAHDLSWF
jgi:hypothetical protein